MRKTDTDLKAIETEHDGWKFRSRLEARWAVILGYLGITYYYEDEGFDLGDGLWYLPDFWLPYHGWWLEIKGKEPTEEETEKARRLAEQSGCPVVILAGNIGDFKAHSFPDSWGDFEILLAAYARMECAGIPSESKDAPMPEGFLDNLLANIEAAYEMAKKERFEHG